MTNEEAKAFLDNLKICINEHPIVADWLVEIENRNDKPSDSEKPNNSTSSKMEQVDKDINVRSKDEPQKIYCPKCGRSDYIKDLEKDFGVKDGTFKYKCINCNTYIKDEPQLHMDGYYRKIEPQTCEDCKHNGEKHAYDYACDKCTNMDKFQSEDEPQTDCYKCADFWNCDGQCDEVENESQTDRP